MNTYRDLEMKVLQWSEARRIIPRSSPLAQSKKTSEETAELLEAAAKLAILNKLRNHLPEGVYEQEHKVCMDEFKDAAGDVVVTLINACALADVDLVDCLAGAYGEIKDRRGELRADGIFVKEQP